MSATPTQLTQPIARVATTAWLPTLHVACAIVMGFGLALLVAPFKLQPLFSLLYYGSTQRVLAFGPDALDYLAFKDGVIGALCLGWGATLMLVVRGPFARGETQGWSFVAAPIAIWFAAEALSTILSGFWSNFLLIAVFALVFAVPLAATWRGFFGHRRR